MTTNRSQRRRANPRWSAAAVGIGVDDRRGRSRAALLMIAAVLLSGCASGAPVPSDPAGLSASVAPPPTYEPDPATIATLRASAELAPCPQPAPGVGGEDVTDAGSRRLPAITLPCLGAGPALDLAAIGGVPYVVNVWASWCGPCAEEMPYLQEVYELAGGRIQVLGIDFEDAPERALLAAADFEITFPSVMDIDGVTQLPLQFQGPPTTFFVSADGEIVATEAGQITSVQQLRELVAEHLGVAL